MLISHWWGSVKFTWEQFHTECSQCYSVWVWNVYIDGLVQARRNSIAYTMELRLYCTNPSICELHTTRVNRPYLVSEGDSSSLQLTCQHRGSSIIQEGVHGRGIQAISEFGVRYRQTKMVAGGGKEKLLAGVTGHIDSRPTLKTWPKIALTLSVPPGDRFISHSDDTG